MSRFVKLTLTKYHIPLCINTAEIESYSTPVPGTAAAEGDTKTIIILKSGDMIGVTESFDEVDQMIRLSVH